MRSQSVVMRVFGVILLLLQSACSKTDVSRERKQLGNDTGPLVVYVTNYPLKYFAERIGGEQVKVHFPVPPNTDPAFWIPDTKTISDYQLADLILLNGAGYEKWVEAASLPRSKLCNTSSKFAPEDFIVVKDAVTHSHGPEGQHSHSGTAFTTWLDPTLAVKQADAICKALAEQRPKLADGFRRNCDTLTKDLVALDKETANIIGKASNRPMVFSHPIYQYFARRYGLNAKSVHWEPDEEPTEAMWKELTTLLSDHPAKVMIWEAKPLDTTANKLTELGLVSIVFDPGANTPREGDYLNSQRKNVNALAKIYSETP